MENDQSILATAKIGGLYILIHLILGGVTTTSLPMSPLRAPATVAILSLVVSIQVAIHDAIHDTIQVPVPVRAVLSMGPCIQIFNGYDILLHTRISYTEHVKWKTGRESINFGDAIWFALTIPVNFRRLGTKWQIDAVYHFDGMAGRIPQKSRFIQQILQSIIYILCIVALGHFASSYFHRPLNQTDLFFLLDQKSLLYIPSGKSLSSHCRATFFFIVFLFLLLKAGYTIFSAIVVLFNVSSPAQWPPFHGPVHEAWSVRRFWRRFWHQTFRGFLTSCADSICNSVLGLRPNSITARYVRYLSCFLISGLIHLPFDLAIGMPLRESGALLFFLIQPLAFAVEDVASALSKRYQVLERDTVAKRLIGYAWVALFCLWSWRVWAYPVLRRCLEIGEPITSTFFLGTDPTART